MSRGQVVTLATSSAIILVLAVVGRGSFLHGLAMVLVVPVALSLLGIGALILRFGGTSPDVRRFAMGVIAFGFVAGSSFVSVPIGRGFNRYDIEQARAYCDRLRPELERYRSRTGRYPERWPSESAEGTLPRLLRGREFYHPFADGYGISFLDPSGMFNGVEFDSRRGEWSEWD